ncbi:MAG: 4Fe-4S dicluster domain-containing protein [Chitinivibrionales bacterium]|nr:4Fe-4S dicluster domain-containing protein [Chitinivibrionales bacterium]
MTIQKEDNSTRNTVIQVAEEGNCLGCGTCEAVCPKKCLRVSLNSRYGRYLPLIDQDTCNNCGKCLSVCPGREILIDQLAKEFIKSDYHRPLLGNYRELLLGYACNASIRYNSASGGLVTALLLYALEKGLIDGALILGTDPRNPLHTIPLIARNRNDILSAMGSKYCPGAVNRGLREILDIPGRYAVAGLPCHVHALRKWQQQSRVLRERIKYVLGLFCANMSTHFGTEYFLRNKNISPKNVTGLRYRAGGWPGVIQVTTNRGTREFKRGTTEKNRKKRRLLTSAFHYDFTVPRCLVCPDQTCELADISFADPHLPELRQKYSDGISWSIVRNRNVADLISAASADNYVWVEPFPLEKALEAQNYKYKESVGGRIAVWKRKGRHVPVFGKDFESTLEAEQAAEMYWWSFYSHNRMLWPLIKITCIIGRKRFSNLRNRSMSIQEKIAGLWKK